MKNFVAGALEMALALLLTWLQPAQAAQVEHASVTTAEGAREFWVAIPDGPFGGPHALVLLLHGHSGNATEIIGEQAGLSPLSQWMAIVDREQIVAIALQGEKSVRGQRGWNDCRGDTDSNPKVDDVAFARAVIAWVGERGWLDRARIYAMGMSNGAMMTLRLAQELEPPLAAFAAVSGSMASASSCHAASHPMSALFIAGTSDPLVPYGGGQVHFLAHSLGGVVSIEDSVEFWRRFDGLPERPVTAKLAHLSGSDPTSVTRYTYSGEDGLQVELLQVSGGGHYEPSLVKHPGLLYSRMVGLQNRDFESAEEAWRFFADKTQAGR
jgi:polyhydroxybutyrate depolymerase